MGYVLPTFSFSTYCFTSLCDPQSAVHNTIYAHDEFSPSKKQSMACIHMHLRTEAARSLLPGDDSLKRTEQSTDCSIKGRQGYIACRPGGGHHELQAWACVYSYSFFCVLRRAKGKASRARTHARTRTCDLSKPNDTERRPSACVPQPSMAQQRMCTANLLGLAPPGAPCLCGCTSALTCPKACVTSRRLPCRCCAPGIALERESVCVRACRAEASGVPICHTSAYVRGCTYTVHLRDTRWSSPWLLGSIVPQRGRSHSEPRQVRLSLRPRASLLLLSLLLLLGMWSSAAQLPTPAYPFEDRRTSKYTRSSHHSSSSSSAGFSTTAFSQPSPSSSASSTSSSLRTPPDLLLNGATLATSLTSPAKGLLGKARVSAAAPATTIRMTVEQLESRLNTLARVSKAPAVSDALPSPPSSPRTRSHDASSSQRTSQKRKADGRTTGSPEARRPRWTSDDNSGVPVDSLSLPRVREWTKEQFFETAVA